MQRFWREPFLHFLILAAALFGLNAVFNRPADAPPDRILVDAEKTARLADEFQRTRDRPPTRRELEDMVGEYVKEEILYREALELGLDQDDPVIRRRMRQKMEIRAAEQAQRQPPADADLEAFMGSRPEMFRGLGRVSFQNVYLDPETTSEPVEQRATRLLARLNADPTAAVDDARDPTPLPRELNAATAAAVSRLFGDAFAATLADAPIGRWFGPVASAHGAHLVRVSERVPGRLPALEEVRPAVEREWSAVRRAEAESAFYDALRARYSVEIEMPPVVPDDPATGNRTP